ncbi:TatD family hydrolase [Aquisalimonas lutea]|uniref:TatD family hydrolase n=1 Tax=Aquisalimonas lutea TaxID=1327750 RepID=UPI0025B60115|nr:TatD family hydrolase [Aquisalimonas lutea]MDN3518441.1 TatD family hydrolase [Aquisalimonas lutea]
MQLVDIGVNLTSDRFRDDREAVLQRAREHGVTTLVVTGTSVSESEQACTLARAHPDQLRATTGVHPHGARSCSAETVAAIRELARANPSVVAIGETGLDFNRDFSPRADQEAAFARHLELAAELQLPVFIHQRDAHERLIGILAEHRDQLVDAVVHCFTDTRRALHDYLDMGLHIGVTGWICDERRGAELQELVRDIPAERLMIETDAPWLLPRDLRPKPRGGRNEPAFLPHIAEAVARHRGETPEQVAASTTAVAERFFQLTQG